MKKRRLTPRHTHSSQRKNFNQSKNLQKKSASQSGGGLFFASESPRRLPGVRLLNRRGKASPADGSKQDEGHRARKKEKENRSYFSLLFRKQSLFRFHSWKTTHRKAERVHTTAQRLILAVFPPYFAVFPISMSSIPAGTHRI